MKTILIVLLFIAIEHNLYSQKKCQSESISFRIDSICKLNNVDNCQVYFYCKHGTDPYYFLDNLLVTSGKFKLDDCFLIVNYASRIRGQDIKGERFFDLSKLIDFEISVDQKILIMRFYGL